jgi:S-adenosylmethionine hydrolase
VGTARKPLALRTAKAFFVGPDNGIFTLVLQRQKLLQAICLDNPRYHLSTVSSTFHGRDIFAPVAAHIACGVSVEELGTPIHRLQRLPLPRIRVDWEGIRATIVHIDRFGNAISNLSRAEYEAWRIRWDVKEPAVQVAASNTTLPIVSTYGDVPRGKPVALFGSSERLEIAVNGGSAARELALRRGDTIKVLRRESTPPPRVQRTLGLQ